MATAADTAPPGISSRNSGVGSRRVTGIPIAALSLSGLVHPSQPPLTKPISHTVRLASKSLSTRRTGQRIMSRKITYPVCRENSIQSLMRDVQFAATVGDTSCPLIDVAALRCGKGHYFFVMSDEADCVEGRSAVARWSNRHLIKPCGHTTARKEVV
jgi:hypothetical protein